MESVKKFEREERYLIVKISKLADDQGDNISRSEQIFRIAHFGKALVNAVVVEEDWPEHEPVWQMIERRMGGKPAVTAAEELAAVLHWRGKHDQAIKERNALQLLLNERDDLEEQNHSLEQRRHAEQQACQAAERRIGELGGLLRKFIERFGSQRGGDPIFEIAEKALSGDSSCGACPGCSSGCRLDRESPDALNPTAEAVSHE